MRPFACGLVVLLTVCARASAQQAPRIGPFVVDLHLTFPKFPGDSAALAKSRDINQTTDLPGVGRGIDVGAQVYLFRWRAVTFGIGGNLMTGRSHSMPPPPPVSGQTAAGQAVTERFRSFEQQFSFNFGNATGWSYLSGGIGTCTWSVVPDTAKPTPADEERIKTINYGGGARWFKKKHVGFSFDVRFYAINPGTPLAGHLAGSPRTTLLVFGVGVSFK